MTDGQRFEPWATLRNYYAALTRGGMRGHGQRYVRRDQIIAIVLVISLCADVAAAGIGVTDDAGQRVTLARPAERIVSLAPHTTEMLFAIGAGAKIVGTAEFSDHPAAARAIPRIGNHDKLDLERIVDLAPDLVIGWRSGNPLDEIARLQGLGMSVYLSEPNDLEAIASNLERLGRLAGHEQDASTAADTFRRRARELFAAAPPSPPVSVFYQVWDDPLITLNGAHLVSEIIRRCGGRNVFSDLPVLAPHVSIEAVLDANPEVIIGGTLDSDRTGMWRQWSSLRAVRDAHLYSVPADLMHRHTPRILDGATQVCAILRAVRDP